MSSDPKSTGTGEADTGAAAAATSGSGSVARALGRGLADVSHLFLQQTVDGRPSGEAVAQGAGSGAAQAGTGARTALVEPPAPAARAALIATLRESGRVLENNLRVIDVGLPCVPYGEIDLVALGGSNQLTIIDVDCSGGDGLLVRGISHVDWSVRNAAILRRVYRGLLVDFARPPRLLLVAPRFSPALTSAVRRFTGLDITCIRYVTVGLSGRTGILFERVSVDHGQ